ncbi:MAG: hypothetical protein NT154_19035 [Verrucomicrobia bacterium]|nr:hypothetical protein [Verrucomicrobiota bacterium]
MLGREKLETLDLHKQALLQASSLNRLALRAEIQSLRSATSWVRDVTQASRESAPLLFFLGPLAGFLLARGARRSGSWLSRVAKVTKWIVPLYQLWKSFSAGRKKAEGTEPAT